MKNLLEALMERLLTIVGYTFGGGGIAILLFLTFFEIDPSGVSAAPGLAGAGQRLLGVLQIFIVVGVIGAVIGFLVGVVTAIRG